MSIQTLEDDEDFFTNRPSINAFNSTAKEMHNHYFGDQSQNLNNSALIDNNLKNDINKDFIKEFDISDLYFQNKHLNFQSKTGNQTKSVSFDLENLGIEKIESNGGSISSRNEKDVYYESDQKTEI